MSRLNNTDFSRLLTDADKNDLTQTRKKKSAETAKERHKQRYLQIVKRQKQKNKEHPREVNVPTRRDRAEERRKATGDYARVAEEYQLLKDRSEEESKFLGGDVEHTHLVKGLDYVLLAKVRSEVEKKEAEKAKLLEEQAAQKSAAPLVVSKETATSLLARKICNEIAEKVHPHHTSFQKKLQRIDSVVLRGAHFRGNTKNFQGGRMSYRFELSSRRPAAPVIVFQSGDESQKNSDGSTSVVAPVHEKILSDLVDLLDFQNKKGGRRNREQYTTLPKDEELYPIGVSAPDIVEVRPKPATVEEEDDIFEGVGSYTSSKIDDVAEENTDDVTAEVSAERGRYFAEDEEDEPPSSAQLLPSGLANKIEAVRRRGGEEAFESTGRTPAPAEVDDYGECYPDMGVDISWGSRGEESDEDDGGKKKKRKGKAGDAGGEKKKPKLTARGAKRQAEREWQQIETYMENKKGRGLNTLENELKKDGSKGSIDVV